jgi:hypothetical protein
MVENCTAEDFSWYSTAQRAVHDGELHIELFMEEHCIPEDCPW